MTNVNLGLTCTRCDQTIVEDEASERIAVRDPYTAGGYYISVRHVTCPTIVAEYHAYRRRVVEAQNNGPSYSSLLPMRYPKVDVPEALPW